MSAALLSGCAVIVAFVLAGWAVVSATREAPPNKLAAGAYAGVDMDTFVSAWTRKFWLRRRADNGVAPSERPA